MTDLLLPEKRLSKLQRVRRTVGWALAMTFFWVWLPSLLLGGALGLWWWESNQAPSPLPTEQEDLGWGLGGLLSVLLLGVVSVWSLGGAVTGALVGLFAPAGEPKAPWRSAFFKRIGRRTFWCWNLFVLLVGFLQVGGFWIDPLWIIIGCYIASLGMSCKEPWKLQEEAVARVEDHPRDER